jgi:hypothetical protein
MTRGDFLKYIDECAVDYVKDSNSVIRNKHMNDYKGDAVPQELIDALIVDFVNYVGTTQGLDYGMYTKDLYMKRNSGH